MLPEYQVVWKQLIDSNEFSCMKPRLPHLFFCGQFYDLFPKFSVPAYLKIHQYFNLIKMFKEFWH